MTALRTPWVVDGRHYCPEHRTEAGTPLVLTLMADDYAHPSEWYQCPCDDAKFVCDHRHDHPAPGSGL